MFVIGMELDFSVLKNKINETLVISHAGILVPFFLGILSSYWVYEEYAAAQTPFLPFALFIGISMSTPFSGIGAHHSGLEYDEDSFRDADHCFRCQ